MMRGHVEEFSMKIVFTNLVTANFTKFSNVKTSGFTFEEPNVGSLKVTSTGTAGNGTIEDGIGTIAGAINESNEKDRLMFELELVTAHFKNNDEIYNFLKKILEKVDEEDDWD